MKRSDDRDRQIVQKENIQISNSEMDNNQIKDNNPTSFNKNKIKNKNCPKQYCFLESLNKIEAEKNKVEIFDTILNDEEDDDNPLIQSSIDDFVKVLKDIKLTYFTSTNISIEDSLNLYFDGKKGNILKRVNSYENFNDIIKKVNEISKKDEPEINQISKLTDKIKNQLENNLKLLSGFMNKIIEDLEKLWQFFDIKQLFEKYEIVKPLNPLEEISELLKINDEEEYGEEIYFLVLVLSYFYIKPKIDEIQRLKKVFEAIDVNEIIKNNIIKREIIKKLLQNICDFNMSSLISNIWINLSKCEEFVEDKKMNSLIKNYICNIKEKDFKSDLIRLIEPYCKELDLNSKGPQNLTVEPFMIQNDLLD